MMAGRHGVRAVIGFVGLVGALALVLVVAQSAQEKPFLTVLEAAAKSAAPTEGKVVGKEGGAASVDAKAGGKLAAAAGKTEAKASGTSTVKLAVPEGALSGIAEEPNPLGGLLGPDERRFTASLKQAFSGASELDAAPSGKHVASKDSHTASEPAESQPPAEGDDAASSTKGSAVDADVEAFKRDAENIQHDMKRLLLPATQIADDIANVEHSMSGSQGMAADGGAKPAAKTASADKESAPSEVAAKAAPAAKGASAGKTDAKAAGSS